MTTLLKTISETKTISDVGNVKATEIVSDGNGGYTRAIRFYGTVANQPPILEVIISATDRANVTLTTPELEF